MTPEIDPHKYAGPLEDLEKKKKPQQNNNGRIVIIIALVLLALGGVIAFYVYSTVGEDGGGNGDSAMPAIPFILIWVAVFVPIFAVKTKKKGPLSAEKKRILVFVIAGIVLLLALTAGLLAFRLTG